MADDKQTKKAASIRKMLPEAISLLSQSGHQLSGMANKFKGKEDDLLNRMDEEVPRINDGVTKEEATKLFNYAMAIYRANNTANNLIENEEFDISEEQVSAGLELDLKLLHARCLAFGLKPPDTANNTPEEISEWSKSEEFMEALMEDSDRWIPYIYL
jgi:hypothetical protein